MIRKGYSEGPFGQIHWRMIGAGDGPDLYCLHPAPFSGLAYTVIMPHLAQGRRVIAPDYPGHGGSDAFRADATIADYATAMQAVVADLSGDRFVDAMGFHTGCLVAASMSQVGRLALIDVPAFKPEMRAEFLASNAVPFDITPNLSCLNAPWDRGIVKRLESQGLDRSFEMFTEQLRHGRAMHAGFHAGFSADVEAILTKMTLPTLVMASQSALLDATRRAASLIPNAMFVERLDIERAVLDEAAAETAAEVLRFLDAA
jgi:pimeloyl-ACP methyl ester carboxylesterase